MSERLLITLTDDVGRTVARGEASSRVEVVLWGDAVYVFDESLSDDKALFYREASYLRAVSQPRRTVIEFPVCPAMKGAE